MKYALDVETNGFGGELISIALVREDNESLYIVFPEPESGYVEWVKENVVPILWSIPSPIPGMAHNVNNKKEATDLVYNFLKADSLPIIVSDWPDDIRYLIELIIVSPGAMVNLDRLVFDVVRVNAYPTTVPGAIQHNAYWDAVALKEFIK